MARGAQHEWALLLLRLGVRGVPPLAPFTREMLVRIAERGGVVQRAEELAEGIIHREGFPSAQAYYASPVMRRVQRAVARLRESALIRSQPLHELADRNRWATPYALTIKGWQVWHVLEALVVRDFSGFMQFTPCEILECAVDRPVVCPECGFRGAEHDVSAWVEHTRLVRHRPANLAKDWEGLHIDPGDWYLS